jgi:hypothetical protein
MDFAAALAEQPGKKIPQLFTRKYEIDAAYELLDQRAVVPEAIQASHHGVVMSELRTPGRYLLLEDTTFPSFSHRKQPIPGLGPIGDSEPGQQGFLLHSVLALRAASSPVPDARGRRPGVTILGLADQQYIIRTPRDPETPKQAGSRQRQVRDRESDRWLRSGIRIGPAPKNPAIRWVRVADREADIYEYMASCREAGHGFVIRVSQNRILLNPTDGKRLGLVFDHITGVAPLGGMYLDLRGRDGQVARRATLLMSCGPVRVRAPERAGQAAGAGTPIDCWFVRVWEEAPPEGAEALEWLLYTDRPTESLADSISTVMDYGTRFLIEEFHKCLKTGMKIEELQLEQANRLFAAIAVMSVVALRLLDLRELGIRCPDAPAESTGLDALELEVLSLAVERPLTKVKDVLLAVGRLGGHMNRRRDGMPGWITLWRGMNELRLLLRGAELERKRINAHVHI